MVYYSVVLVYECVVMHEVTLTYMLTCILCTCSVLDSEWFACYTLTIQYNVSSTVGRSIASISAMDLPTVLYILRIHCVLSTFYLCILEYQYCTNAVYNNIIDSAQIICLLYNYA